MTAKIQGKLTGRTVTHYGRMLPEVEAPVGEHTVCQIGEVAYYVFDFGGVLAGSRTARGVDYGGNVVHNERTAPKSKMGLAAPLRGLPVRVAHGEPEVFFRG